MTGEPVIAQLEAGSKVLNAIASSLSDRADGLFAHLRPAQLSHFKNRLPNSRRSRLEIIAALRERSAIAGLVRSPIDLAGLDALMDEDDAYVYGSYAPRVASGAALPNEVDEGEAIAVPVAFADLLTLAGEDNPVEWGQAITAVLPEGGRMELHSLCQKLHRPLVEVWVGCLLGGFQLEPEPDGDEAAFYDRRIWVCR